MKYSFYTSSQSAWEGICSALESAQKSIYIEMYIFIDDTEQAHRLVNILKEKSNEGILIKIVLDAFGSKELSSQTIKILRDAGVEVLFFDKIFRRLHRKMVIVDEKVGFIGGVNIHRDAQEWFDLLVGIEGDIVSALIESFQKVYRACKGKDNYILAYHKQLNFNHEQIWFLEHLPFKYKPQLKNQYKKAIASANKEVIIVTPYFLPHRWLKKLLKKTLQRGIKIKILIPHKTDSAFITKANYIYMRIFGKKGIEFYVSPYMNHSKILLVDNSLALVGSQNIDALSFDFNIEGGLFYTNENMIADTNAIINTWKGDSRLFDPYQKVSLFDRMYSYFIRLIESYL